MKLDQFVEGHWEPTYFVVREPFPIFTGGNFHTRSREETAQPGDEIHDLPGGTFLVRDGKVVFDGFVPLDEPDATEPFHHEYRNSPAAFKNRRFKKLLAAGNIDELSREMASNVKYRT